MSAAELIAELVGIGVELAAEGDQLTVRAPRNALSSAHRQLLVQHKQEVLRLLRGQSNEPETRTAGSIVPDPGRRWDPFPLTDIQQAYWVGRATALDLGGVGCYAYREFDSLALDIDRLEQAWRRLIDRHDMLRARFTPDGQQQVLREVPAYAFRRLDLRGRPEAEVLAELEHIRGEMSHQVLPAECGPLFDVQATLLDGSRVRLHFGFDLLIADAASLFLLFREWRHFCEHPEATLPPLALAFRDCVLAEQALRGREAFRLAEAYWFQRLATLPPAPALPLRLAPEALGRPRFVRRTHRLDPARWRRLKGWAGTHGLTPSSAVCAAFAEVLSVWSASRRFTLTLTFFTRPAVHPELNRIVGDFTSTILLDVDGTGETFAGRAQRLQEQLGRDLHHTAVSGVHVLRELHRRGAATAGFPIVFTSALGHRHGDGEESPPTAWLGETVFSITQTPQVWLDHHVVEEAGALIVSWDAAEDLYPPGLLDEMFAAYVALLERLTEDESIGQAPGRLVAVRDRSREVPFEEAVQTGELLHTRFLAQAAQQPEQPAVIAGGQALSCAELSARARQVGKRLRESKARPNTLVAVVLEKGWQQVVAVLGVLEAGAAYLPVDPSLPAERFRYLLRQGEVQVALTEARLDERLAWPTGVERLCLDRLEPASHEPCAGPLQPDEDLAYVIFTSGSTGWPKGVMIDHRGAVGTIRDLNDRFGVGPGDRVLALSSLSFDLSVYDIFGILAAGGTIVLPEPDRLRDPGHWAELLIRERVTIWNSVPALMTMLMEYVADRPELVPPALRLVLLSGDWIPVALPDRIREWAPAARVISLGGATEASIWSIAFPIEKVDPLWKSIPYGRPLRNQFFRILDDRLEPCPAWVPGQLFIGGAGLAKGYWRDEAKTGASFLRHPRTGERLYATGDWGRYWPDGTIEFLGRQDSQVKVQGHRIELGEIESALRQHPEVREAVAAVAGERHEEKRLVAGVVPAVSDRAAEPSALPGTIQDPAERLAFKLRQPGLRRLEAAGTVPLAAPEPTPDLASVYRGRRSQRRFRPEPISREAFGLFLSCLKPLPRAGSALPKYRYPSAGDLYPVQVCVHVKPGRIEGLAGGTFHYDPRDHRLVPLREGAELDRAIHAPPNRAIFDEAAFSLFLVGQLQAIAPLYGEAARDLCLLEAGYIGQLLMTTAPDHRIGLCPIGGLDFAPVRPLLVLDEGHVFLHAFLGGMVDPHDNENPPSSETDRSGLVPRLRAFLHRKLPDHMVPAAFVLLERLPLTANGKVDRQALLSAEADQARPAEPEAAPQSESERRLAELVQAVLGTTRVGRHENFFEMGATSLHLIQIHRRLRETLGRDVSVVELFRHPTIHALAAHLEDSGGPSPALQQARARAEARRAARPQRSPKPAPEPEA